MKKEFRIGNLLMSANGPVEISAISENGSVRLKGINSWFTPGECLPHIPLTKEWLLKFGFINGEKDNFSFTKNMDLRIIGLENDYNGIWVGEIKHVHQLQNLYFALTGKELDYE